MLDFLASVLATTIEGASLFYFTLIAFRFKPREHLNAIIIANLLVAISNYLMEKYNFFYDYTPLLNILIMLIIFVLLFQISLLYSIVMSLAAFVSIFALQGIAILIFNFFNQVTLQQLRLEDVKYVLQSITGVCFILIGYFLQKWRIGFTKVPFTRSFRIKLTKFNTLMIMSFVFLLCIMSIIIKYNNLLLACTICSLLSVMLTYSLYRKEKCDD